MATLHTRSKKRRLVQDEDVGKKTMIQKNTCDIPIATLSESETWRSIISDYASSTVRTLERACGTLAMFRKFPLHTQKLVLEHAVGEECEDILALVHNVSVHLESYSNAV